MTDLGVLIIKNLKSSIQSLRAASRAYRMLSIIKFDFKFLDSTTLAILCKIYALLFSEYCSICVAPIMLRELKFSKTFSASLPISPAFRDVL